MKRLQVSASAYRRLAALTGVIFVAIAMATPDPTLGVEKPSAEAIEQFYVRNEQGLRVAFLLSGLAYAFFLLFLMALRAEFRKAEHEASSLSVLVTASGTLVAGFHVLGTTLWAAPALQLDGARDPTLVGASTLVGDVYRNALVEVSTFWRGVLLATLALIALRHRTLPQWLGWLAAALAFGAFIGSISFLDLPGDRIMVVLGFGSYIGFFVWVLLTSVVLAVRHRRTSPSRAVPGELDPRPRLT